MNGNEPATKQDIADLRAELEQQRNEFKAGLEQLRAENSHQYNDLMETLRDSETKLLQAFYGFAGTTEKRQTQTDANVAVFLSRVTTLESRVLELEKRLNMPPAS